MNIYFNVEFFIALAAFIVVLCVGHIVRSLVDRFIVDKDDHADKKRGE